MQSNRPDIRPDTIKYSRLRTAVLLVEQEFDLTNQVHDQSTEQDEEMTNLELLKQVVLNSSTPIFSSAMSPKYHPGNTTPIKDEERNQDSAENSSDDDIPFQCLLLSDCLEENKFQRKR